MAGFCRVFFCYLVSISSEYMYSADCRGTFVTLNAFSLYFVVCSHRKKSQRSDFVCQHVFNIYILGHFRIAYPPNTFAFISPFHLRILILCSVWSVLAAPSFVIAICFKHSKITLSAAQEKKIKNKKSLVYFKFIYSLSFSGAPNTHIHLLHARQYPIAMRSRANNQFVLGQLKIRLFAFSFTPDSNYHLFLLIDIGFNQIYFQLNYFLFELCNKKQFYFLLLPLYLFIIGSCSTFFSSLFFIHFDSVPVYCFCSSYLCILWVISIEVRSFIWDYYDQQRETFIQFALKGSEKAKTFEQK